MSEHHITRELRLANERVLYRYHQALERGDIETITTILQEASQNEELERMIFAMYESDQPAGQLPPLPSKRQLSTISPLEPALRSHPQHSIRRQQIRRGLQVFAALLVVATLIVSSVLLLTSRHFTPDTGNHTSPPPPTKAVVAAQGMVILLLANGDIQAVRGGTGQLIWSYATGLGSDMGSGGRGLIVHNQGVYVMAKNHIIVLNEKTGQLLWQKKLSVQPMSTAPDEDQILLESGVLYVSLQSTPHSVAYALRASDGQLLWQVSSTDLSPPLLTASNGIVYVAIQNAAVTQTIMQARRGSDGHVLWSYTSPGAISFATVANQVLYVYAFPGDVPPGGSSKLNKRLLAFKTSNGDLIWSRDVNYGNYTTNIAYAQGVLIVSDGYEQICAHSASNGTLLWCVPKQADVNGTSGVSIASYLVGSDKLYMALITQHDFQIDFQIESLDLQSGQPQWTNNLLTHLDTEDPLLSLGLVQLQQGTLLVATGSVLVTALDTSSGHTLWQINASAPQSSVLQLAGTP